MASNAGAATAIVAVGLVVGLALAAASGASRVRAPSPRASTGAAAGVQAAALAMSQRGKPYVIGHAGPDAFDCSGLVAFAYGREHQTAYDLMAEAKPINLTELRPGDLLFYNYGEGGEGGVDHVVIYAGGGQVVAAATPAKGVLSYPLDTHNFIGAGRIT